MPTAFELLLRVRRRYRSTAFSLVEVVLAIGIFAAAIVAVLGLLPSSTQAVTAVLDSEIANRLSQNIQAELNRLGFATISGLFDDYPSIQLVASSDGSRVLRLSPPDPGPADNDLDAALPGIAERDRQFLITLDTPTEITQTTFDAGRSGSRPVRARVEWPYRVPVGPASGTKKATGATADLSTPVDAAQRRSMTLFFGVSR